MKTQFLVCELATEWINENDSCVEVLKEHTVCDSELEGLNFIEDLLTEQTSSKRFTIVKIYVR